MNTYLAIDLQKERAFGNESVYENAVKFTRAAYKAGNIVLTTQFVTPPPASSVKQIKKYIMPTPAPPEFPYTKRLRKTSFGINPNWVIANRKGSVFLYGCDSDASVLVTAFRLFDKKIEFYVLSGFCFSSSGMLANERALSIMRMHFGSAVLDEDTGEKFQKRTIAGN